MLVTRGLVSLVALLSSGGVASAFELQGTTFCGGTRMVGATVQALVDATQQEAGLATTDGAGHYGLSLGATVYDLIVTPPAGSLCLPATVHNKEVTGDEAYDIILVPQDEEEEPPVLIQISGSVVMDDAPQAGLTVNVYRPSGNYTSYDTVTDPTGHFSVTVPVGRYAISLYNEDERVAPHPQWFECYVPPQDYAASASKAFAVRTGSITGTAVTSPNPGVAAGVRVSFGSSRSEGGGSCWGGGETWSDAAGRFGPHVILAEGSGSISTSPVAGVYLSGSRSFSGPAPGAALDLEVVVPQVQSASVSGSLTLADGSGIADAEVEVYRTNGGGETYHTTTDGDGRFSVSVPFGTYSLQVGRYEQASSDLPSNVYCWAGQIAVNGPVSRDFVVSIGYAQGEVRTQGSLTPIAGANIDVYAVVTYGSQSSCESWVEALTTDAEGRFGPVMTLGGAQGGAYTAARPGVYYAASTQFSIPEGGTGSGVILVAPFESYAVSGHIEGNGAPIEGMNVEISRNESYYAATDGDGDFSVVVPKGTYYVNLEKYGDNGPLEPWNLYCWYSNIVVDRPVTLDRTLAWSRVSGRVTTDRGIPIAGVQVVGDSSFQDGQQRGCGSYWEGVSDDSGRYSFLLLHGTSYYSFTPSAGSGYKTVSLSSPLGGTLNQVVVLQLPDIVPPNLLGPPVVIHHSNTSVSIQWGTNEATNGRLEYQEGSTLGGSPSLVDKPAYVTDHIVTLKDLAPLTEYAFRITSKDPSGNAVTSGVLTFTTVELPDTEPPLIVGGPSVTFLAPTQIRVSWTTNEPATSHVDYGLAGGALTSTKGSDESALLHDVLLTGLTPETTYTLVVRSSDPDGNGPTTSAPFDVATPGVSDTTPPVVSNLRTECVTHERMAVCWDTDEPATSNVAYENQSTQVASGISSGALVTSRCMSLTGLAPATSYRISVSSADGGASVGTGGPIFQTTGVDAADGAPVVSDLRAEYTSPTSARVSWTTDTPASTFVRWGASAGGLDRTAGDVTASETSHVVLLTGLTAGAPVWVQASSTNPCLQSGSAGPIQVIDVDECTDGPGCAPPGVCIDTVGGYRCEHAPMIAAQSFDLAAEVAAGVLVGTVAASDADGESVTRSRVGGDDAGALAVAASGAITVVSPAAVAARAGGTFSLVVRATDPGGRFAEATITIVVAPAEDVDGCLEDNGGCDHGCVDLPVGVACECEDGYVLAGDGTTCLVVGECGAGVTCDPATGPLVFFGVVTRAGVEVGSIRCVREVDGDIACDVDEDGALVVSPVLWCSAEGGG